MDSYPRPQNLTYADRVLSNEGPPSRGDPFKRTERKLAGPGRPGTVDGLVAGGALGGAAPCLGRARLPCRARWVHHLPQGCPLVPWRLPPLHRLARFARHWQTSDALRRENAEASLFEIWITPPVSRARCGILHAASQNRDRTNHRRPLRPRLCSAPLREELRHSASKTRVNALMALRPGNEAYWRHTSNRIVARL